MNKGLSATITKNEMIIRNKGPKAVCIRAGQRIMEERNDIKKIKETREEEEFIEKILAVKESDNTADNEEIPQFEGDETITDLEGIEIKGSRHLKKNERSKALRLLYRFRDIFTCEIKKIKKIKAEPYEIILDDDTPVKKKSYPLTPKEREKGRQLLKELEDSGIIEKSRTNYCSPGFSRVKKNAEKGTVDTARLVVDFKEVNKKIAKDANAPPRVQAVIEAL